MFRPNRQAVPVLDDRTGGTGAGGAGASVGAAGGSASGQGQGQGQGQRRRSESSTSGDAPSNRHHRRSSGSGSGTGTAPIDIAPRNTSRSSSFDQTTSSSFPLSAPVGNRGNGGTGSSLLPHYSPLNTAPIPTYDSVLTEAAEGLRAMRQSRAMQMGQTPVDDTPLHAPVTAWQSLAGTTSVQQSTGPVVSPPTFEDSDDDDPLIPRIRRPAPLRQQRRNTFSGISSLADIAPLTVPLPPRAENRRRGSEAGAFASRGNELETHSEDVFEEDETETEEGSVPTASTAQSSALNLPVRDSVGQTQDDTLTRAPHTHPRSRPPLPIPTPSSSSFDPSRESEIANQPAPPSIALLPAYSAHLAPEEIRLISTVHLDESHPSQAFFTSLANSLVHATPTPADDPQREQAVEFTTGGRKLKLILTKGGVRMNENNTGPLYIKIGRGGKIQGRVEVGKVDYATSLEVSVIGLVNTSYYVRGQYTLIDTLPLVRRQVKLYPPEADGETHVEDVVREDFSTLLARANEARPAAGASTAQGTNGTGGTPATATSTTPSAPMPIPVPTSAPASATPTGSSLSRTISANFLPKLRSKDKGKDKNMTKDGVPFLQQGQSFEFDLTMPHSHYRDGSSELPPSCQIYQVGMQAGVEYVMRIKMARKGWRMNETITVPVIYEPRAYITPRRLRALTTNDALNPGWRTIRLHGGKPSPKAQPAGAPPPTGPGVEASLLLPSPPILYFAQCDPPPPIPFHLHFHSSLPLPLETFSDPRKSNFVIRLMRVATLRIGSEKEIRRMEIPSVVEIWQEGGPRCRIGDSTGGGGSAAGFRIVDMGESGMRGGGGDGDGGGGEVGGERERYDAEGGRRSSEDTTAGMGMGMGMGMGSPAMGVTALSPISEPTNVSGADDGNGLVQDTPSPISPTSPTSPTSLMSHMTTAPSTLASVTSPTSPTSPSSPTPPISPTESTGRRRLSFLRRRSTTETHHTSPLARVLSNIPPIHESHDSTANGSNDTDPAAPAAAATTAATAEVDPPEPMIFTPLPLGCTDVHLLGHLTISPKITGTEVARRMVQSFNTPDIGITYVLEVGIQPKSGAVREAFDHVWGGGIVEVVLAPKVDITGVGGGLGSALGGMGMGIGGGGAGSVLSASAV